MSKIPNFNRINVSVRVLSVPHQNISQVVFAVVRSVLLRLAIHRQSVVVVFGVLLLQNQQPNTNIQSS